MTVVELRRELAQRDLLDDATHIAKCSRVTLDEMLAPKCRLGVQARHAFIKHLFGDPQAEWSESAIGRLLGLDRSTVHYALHRRDRRAA